MDDQSDNWITGELARARGERAPEKLRLRIAALSADDVPVVAPPPRWVPLREVAEHLWRGRAIGLSGGFAVVCAVIAVIVVMSLPAHPTVAQAAVIAQRSPNLPAPQPERRDARFLRSGVGPLHFPNWSTDEGYVAYGGRKDPLGNQTVLTVYYRDTDGEQIAYSIVDGKTLKNQGPQGVYRTFHQGRRTVVSWQLDGHSCLLSARSVPAAELVSLARSVYVQPDSA